MPPGRPIMPMAEIVFIWVQRPDILQGHAVKVSYNRPFTTRSGGGGSSSSEDWVFNAEYPMIRWLERNGYDVSYTTDVDMDRNPLQSHLPNIKCFFLSGMMNTGRWTKETNLKQPEMPVSTCAFFSGNEVYWKTRWENSIDGSGTPYRTLVCYKEGTLGENVCNGECDPTTIWTGLWRDGCGATGATDGCKPENALTGQISWAECHMTSILCLVSIRISASGAIPVLHRFRRPNSYPSAGTLGYEWDFEQPAYAGY